MTTIVQANKQNRLALRRTCGGFSAGTRVRIAEITEAGIDVEKQVQIVEHNRDGQETARYLRWKHEIVSADDLVILRRRITSRIFL